jgi:hypothetical protein
MVPKGVFGKLATERRSKHGRS